MNDESAPATPNDCLATFAQSFKDNLTFGQREIVIMALEEQYSILILKSLEAYGSFKGVWANEANRLWPILQALKATRYSQTP